MLLSIPSHGFVSAWFRFLKCSLLTILVQGLFAAAHSVADTPTKIVIAYENKTQFPYYLGDSTAVQSPPGAAVDLVLALQEKIPGIEIELQRYPWGRCIAMLEAGKVDAIFNASYSDDRAKFGAYPRTSTGELDPQRRLTTISYSWYAQKGTETNAAKHVAAPLGYSIVDSLRADGYRVTEVAESEFALRMLLAGHVSKVALQTVTGDHLLAYRIEFNELERVTPAIVTKPYFLLFSKAFYQQHPELTESIWNELEQLRSSTMEGLIARYLSD